MKISANEAARRTGKSTPTITRAIKSGKISAEKVPDGGYLIDPSELFRVFKAVTLPSDVTPAELQDETPKKAHTETQSLHEKIALLEGIVADLRSDRDEWREQAKRLALAKPETEPSDQRSESFWTRIFSKKSS